MTDSSSELLADADDIVREQLALAWREHIERVKETLEAQWPVRMERVLEETVAGLAARLQEEHRDALEAQAQQFHRSADAARRELIQKLNQTTRRLRAFENERQWANTLVDSTRGFCGRAALFLVRDRKLHLETTRNFDDADLGDEVPLEQAPALATAIDTRDTLVAMRTASELSGPIAAYLNYDEAATDPKCHLFPVLVRDDVPSVLYVDSGDIDVSAIELLVAIAGAVLDSRPAPPVEVAPDQEVATAVRHGNGLVTITATALPGPSTPKPEILSWFSLTREDRELHLRAQRFARVQVAGMTLYQAEGVKKGRTSHDLYTSLRKEIDSARDAYRREFLDASDSMVDYLHLELVRTLANDDVEVLGKDYPGPMV